MSYIEFVAKSGRSYNFKGVPGFPYTEGFVILMLGELPWEEPLPERTDYVYMEGAHPEAEELIKNMIDEIIDLNGVISDLEDRLHKEGLL